MMEGVRTKKKKKKKVDLVSFKQIDVFDCMDNVEHSHKFQRK